MVLKTIKPVDGAARIAAINKYDPDRQSRERGRRQQLSDSSKPKPEKKEPQSFDKFFASTAQKPVNELSEFEMLLLLKTMQEDNRKMLESAKTLESTPTQTENLIEAAYVWGSNNYYRPVISK